MKKLKQTARLAIGFGLAVPAFAQEITGTGLSLNLESAQIVGTGRTVNMHRVPVTNIQNGDTTFYDVTAKFSLDGNGNVIFDEIMSPTVSAPLNVSTFRPGIYRDSAGHTYRLSGPAQAGGSRTTWTLVCQDCRTTATWTTGSAVGHPNIGSAQAQELPAGYSYGIIGQEAASSNLNAVFDRQVYDAGEPIGAQQVGNSLQVSLFADGDAISGAPKASVTLLSPSSGEGS